jgi:hypothetical protein
MPNQFVKAGTFDAKPNSLGFGLNVDKIGYWVKFTQNCNYLYADPNQQDDILKFWGRAFALFPWDKHSNSAIGGFRHMPANLQLQKNQATKPLQLFDYWHIDNKVRKDDDPVTSVDFNELFAWWLEINKDAKTVSQVFYAQGQKHVRTQQFTKIPSTSWNIGGYAGGDQVATQDMLWGVTRIERWVNGLPAQI